MTTNALGFTPEQENARQNENRTNELLATFYTLIPLSIIAVILRLISRRVGKIRIWWDDWLIIFGLIFALGLNAALLTGTYNGLGQHVEFAGKVGLITNAKIVYAAELIYVTSMSFTKIAILVFYYRIFRHSLRFHTAVWVMGTVIICWYLTSVFVGCFQCYPARFLWDRTILGGFCFPEDALWIGSSVSSLITDAAILCLPMPIIWNLRATWRQRLAVSAMLLLGGFVCVTSILRLTTIHQLSLTDATYTNVDSAIWTSVECSVAVISACLPTLKPLFRGVVQSSHIQLSPDPNKKGRGNSDASDPKSTHAAHWRSAANEKRICNLDTSEFKRCDERQASFGTHGGLYIDRQGTTSPSRSFNYSRPTPGAHWLDSGIITNSTPQLHGPWEDHSSAV